MIKNNEEYKGKNNLLFGNNNPIHIEIGMGKGKFITNMALLHPNINFIGIEMFSSVIVRAVEKADKLELPNLKLMLLDAKSNRDIFANEIDMIYLNFSDPWPKKRHAKRRLSSNVFLEQYDKIFRNDANIVMKTDNMALFEYSLSSLSEYGYVLNEVNLDLHSINDKTNVETEYETKFSALGKPIYRVKARKCK